jgi:glutamine amidotransferase
MKTLTIGIVDYGMGNLGSVQRTINDLGYRSRVSSNPNNLSEADLLLLPGVGAFPLAMEAMHGCGLVDFLRQKARNGRPIVGICLGMQLLADSSTEFHFTAGLGLIPGNVVALPNTSWHIGWNALEALKADDLMLQSHGQYFYFNHSFVFEAAGEYQIATTKLDKPLTSAVRSGNVVGLQFHPEKSQVVGRELLRNVIEGLCRA